MKKETSLVFTGDIGFDRYMYEKWNDDELISQEILDFLHSADHVVANVEGPVAKAEQNTTTNGVQQLLHTIDPAATKVLKNMHADIWNICNNHIMDAGEYGIECTLREAEKCGAKTIGAGMDIHQARKPVILDEAGGILTLGWAIFISLTVLALGSSEVRLGVAEPPGTEAALIISSVWLPSLFLGLLSLYIWFML